MPSVRLDSQMETNKFSRQKKKQGWELVRSGGGLGWEGSHDRGCSQSQNPFCRLLSLLPSLIISPSSQCSLTFFSRPPRLSNLSPLSLSLHPFGGASLSPTDNACNWSDSHFSSVFAPDKEYCQRFFSPTWPPLEELNGLCSLLSAAN